MFADKFSHRAQPLRGHNLRRVEQKADEIRGD
jgi:hypothetical protein